MKNGSLLHVRAILGRKQSNFYPVYTLCIMTTSEFSQRLSGLIGGMSVFTEYVKCTLQLVTNL